MKLYIHIGTGKTGSSAIQGVLNHNRRKLLEEFGLLYPNTMGPRFEEGDGHNHSAFLLNEPLETQVHRSLDFIRYAEKNKLRGIVFSSETHKPAFQHLLTELMSRHRGLDPLVIVYFRRQDHLLESSWKEWGGHDGIKDFDAFFNDQYALDGLSRKIRPRSRLNYAELLRQWEACLPREQLRVRVYEPEQLRNRDVVQDFLMQLGIPSMEGFQKPPVSRKTENRGYGPAVVELMRKGWGLGDTRLDQHTKDLVYAALGPEARKQPFARYPFLSPRNRIQVLEASESSNRHIAQTYLNREDGRLFYEPWPDENEAWEPPTVPEELLWDHLLKLILHVRQRRETLQQELLTFQTPTDEPLRTL